MAWAISNRCPVNKQLYALAPNAATRLSQSGATLIELVASMVILAIALTLLSTTFFGQPLRSVDPLLQMRAAELGLALVDEVLSKRFDETSPVGGVPVCTSCTAPGSLGAESGESRASFDDVDDFNAYCGSIFSVTNALGTALATFSNYGMTICVSYDGNYDGSPDSDVNAKLILVDVYPPASSGNGYGTAIRFSAYRGNY